MNYIFISPNFPETFYKIAVSLKKRGVTVLGIGDAPYESLKEELKDALTEYAQVHDMSVYQHMLDTCRYYESKYGHIDFVESNNEWWLFQDAKLREDLGVTSGFLPYEMNKIKAKSEMKKCFMEAGVKTMRYVLLDGPQDLEKALSFANEVSYPVFVKPNVGVGASDSFKLHNEDEVRKFLNKPLPETYIMEEYIDGEIISFDGVCDSNSDCIVSLSNHFDTNSSDMVEELSDDCYYIVPFELGMNDIDGPAFLEAGKRVVKAFGIKKRFFHIEFFVLNKDKEGFARKGEFVALECNMRPCGGNTTDLYSIACGASIYEVYADIVTTDINHQNMNEKKWYAIASSKRNSLKYKNDLETIRKEYAEHIVIEGTYPEGYSDAMGDYYMYSRWENLEEGLRFDKTLREKQ